MDSELARTILRLATILVLLGAFAIFLAYLARSGRQQEGQLAPHAARGSTHRGEPSVTNEQDLRLKSRLYYYRALVIDVYDGDTVTVDVDLGLGIWQRNQTVRLWKVNTPEVRGPERPEGLKVRDFVRSLVLNKTILLRTILDKRGEDRTGKFGRLLGELLVEAEDGALVNVNELLLERGMAQLMDEDGVVVRSAATRSTGSPPTVIACPFCGAIRSINTAAGVIVACPNCLDHARPLEFLQG